MAKPTNRETLVDYCLKKLGKPLININIHDEQIEDRIDDALQMYLKYHEEGREDIFIIHELTQEDIDSQTITLPEEVVGVQRVMTRSTGYTAGGGLFSAEYQVMLSDYLQGGSFSFTTGGLSNFYILKRNFSEFEHLFRPETGYQYNRVTGKLRFQRGITRVGKEVAIRVYLHHALDTNGDVAYEGVWNNDWFKKYCTALIKRQWGANLKKFKNVELMGGVVLDGDAIFLEADQEIEKLEEELTKRYSLPIVPVMA